MTQTVHVLLVKEPDADDPLIGGIYTTRRRADAAADRYLGARVVMDPITLDADQFISIARGTVTRQEDNNA